MKALFALLVVALVGCTPAAKTSPESVTDTDSGYVFDDPAPAAASPQEAEALAEGAEARPTPPQEPLAQAEPDPEPAPPAEPARRRGDNTAQRLKCEKRGGTFAKTEAGVFLCARLTGEGQQTCNGPGDCQGECLARSRTCSPMAPLVGCHDLITASGSIANVCLN